jgi:hypothetical protein
MAALTSGARSCWVQCPQPGRMIEPRSWGTNSAIFANPFADTGEIQHDVVFAGYIERRHRNLRSSERSKKFPKRNSELPLSGL